MTAAAVIAGCIGMLTLAELGARAVLNVSRIERRTTSEIVAAEALRGGGRRRVLLFVGNSLLLEGIDFPALQRALEPQADVHRLVVEQTSYLDWYYGLRRLFAGGSRPEIVVLKLNPVQLLSRRFRGDYSANRLIASSDLFAAARDADLSPTQASSFWIAHYSTFYGLRAELRKWLLSIVMPRMQELSPYLAQYVPQHVTGEEILQLAPGRLRAMRQLAARQGARLVLLVPASLTGSAETSALTEAGRRAGVEVLAPVAPELMLPSDFRDGFHLNASGAEKYTAALVPALKRVAIAQ